MNPEEYLYDDIDQINECLNCTLPVECCHGLSNCAEKNRFKMLEMEIHRRVLTERKTHLIARDLGVTSTYVRKVIVRLVNKGLLTQEQADKAYLKRSNDETDQSG